MKIKELHIEKFRSIYSCNIRLKDITAIVGENNSGKTTILRALNAFFHFEEEEKFFLDNTHRFSPRANTKIEIVFEEVPNRDFYADKEEVGLVTVGIKYKYSSHKRSIYYKKSGNVESIDEEMIREIKSDIDYLYVPASRSNYDLKWNENSIFSKLVIEFARKYTESRDMVSNHVLNASKKLHSSILNKIESQLSSLFPTNENYGFDINYKTNIDYNILLDNLVLNMREKDTLYPIQEYGSGIKSLAIISIFRMLASMSNIDVVLGIEEPETNLHPQMQKQFIASMKDGKRENEVQVLLATHSTVIVDELKHDDIILVRREYDSRRGYITVATQIQEGFWERAGIEEFNYYQFFDYRNSDFFFSKYVVITESKTDTQVIGSLISRELGWKMSYVSLINLNGVTSLAYPYFLLKELKIPFSVIVDRDFFTQYEHDELEMSRDDISGLPNYKNTLNQSNIIDDFLITQNAKQEVLNALNSKVYKRIFDALRPYKFYTMQYCLEMDMTCSESICREYYAYLNMTPEHQSQRSLLKDKKKAIKKIDYILKALENVRPQSYPISLKKIKRGIMEDISQYI